MAQEHVGQIVSVDTRNAGEVTTADHAAGTTVLGVTDAATFEETGGTVLVNDVPLTYVAVDTDLDTLTLAAPLTVAVLADSTVEVYPARPEKIATVDMGGEGDAIPAVVPHALVALLADGVRDPEAQETVTVDPTGARVTVSDIVGRPPVQDDLTMGSITPTVSRTFSLREWIVARRQWLAYSDVYPLTTTRTINSTTNTYLTEAVWDSDIYSDGLIQAETDTLYLFVTAALDVTCTTEGNTLIGELCVSELTSGAAETFEPRQLVVYGKSASRAMVFQQWRIGLSGGLEQLGYGEGSNHYRLRLRVRSAGTTASYIVNHTHSSLAVNVQGSLELGG